MIGLSLTSTVRRVEAERDEARECAEKAAKRARSWQECWRAADQANGRLAARNAVLTARVATLQDQIDAQPTRAANGRFAKREERA